MIKLNLKAYAISKGVAQKELVEKTGIRQPTISAIYNNKAKHIPIDALDKICDVLDCQPGEWIEHINNIDE